MTVKERHDWERKLLEEISRIGETVKGITPETGHLSLIWFPDGHVDVAITDRHFDADGNEKFSCVLDAWGNQNNGVLEVHRV